MLAVIVLLVGAAVTGYRLLEEMRFDTGGLEVTLVATVAQLAAAAAGLLRLPGASVTIVLLLGIHVLFWIGMGMLVFLFGVLPNSGGWGMPAHPFDLGLLFALVAGGAGITILYRHAFRSAVALRTPHPPAAAARGQP